MSKTYKQGGREFRQNFRKELNKSYRDVVYKEEVELSWYEHNLKEQHRKGIVVDPIHLRLIEVW